MKNEKVLNYWEYFSSYKPWLSLKSKGISEQEYYWSQEACHAAYYIIKLKFRVILHLQKSSLCLRNIEDEISNIEIIMKGRHLNINDLLPKESILVVAIIEPAR